VSRLFFLWGRFYHLPHGTEIGDALLSTAASPGTWRDPQWVPADFRFIAAEDSTIPLSSAPFTVSSRRRTREFVLQVLFAADAGKKDPLETLEFLERHFSRHEDEEVKMSPVLQDFARGLVLAVSKDRDEIDRLISLVSRHWKLHRISRVDRNILRMAIAELVNFPETPGRVVLDEAIEIGKKFGAENSGAFVNGILDRIHGIENRSSTPFTLQDLLTQLDDTSTTS
jgi:transcription antitermination protein NusB